MRTYRRAARVVLAGALVLAAGSGRGAPSPPSARSTAATRAPAPAAALDRSGPPYPRLANVYLHGAVREADIPALARWDVLVLATAWSNEQLSRLRALNPAVRIFLYVCPYCVNVPPNAASPWDVENYRYAESHDLWWYDRHCAIAADWPNTRMVNITGLAPVPPLGAWREYLAARVEELADSRPMVDGIFYDNFWRGISWEQGRVQLDSDCNPTHAPAGCDGRADAPARLDSLWNAALRALAADTRARFDRLETAGRARPLALAGNGVSDYFESMNGTMYELFPESGGPPDPGSVHGYRWNPVLFDFPAGYLVAPLRASPYRVPILNAAWSGSFERPERSADFERHKRFTLASALLGDGYYSLDPARVGHGALWWEPEYDHDGRGKGYLGYPLGPAVRVPNDGVPEAAAKGDGAPQDARDTAVFRRDFERGVVLLNYTAGPYTAVLGRTYHRLHIAGSDVFDGAAVRRETVPPSDARILLLQSSPRGAR